MLICSRPHIAPGCLAHSLGLAPTVLLHPTPAKKQINRQQAETGPPANRWWSQLESFRFLVRRDGELCYPCMNVKETMK